MPLFASLMDACDLSADALYRHYVGKNVLNFFRQDHGYQDRTYIKKWQGGDNEHLSELLDTLDATAAGFPEAVYEALSARCASDMRLFQDYFFQTDGLRLYVRYPGPMLTLRP